MFKHRLLNLWFIIMFEICLQDEIEIKSSEIEAIWSKISNNTDIVNDEYLKKQITRMVTNIKSQENDSNFTKLENKPNFITTSLTNESNSKGLTIPRQIDKNLCCSGFTDEICPKIISLNTFKCNSVDKLVLPIMNICDGSVQCRDGSDEWNCTGYVQDKINITFKILMEIENYVIANCFSKEESLDILRKNQLFIGVLHTESIKLKHFDGINITQNINNIMKKWEKAKKIGNSVTNVIKTIATAMNSTLCYQYDNNEVSENKIDYIDTMSSEAVQETGPWTLNSCKCKGPYCLHKRCKYECNFICAEAYSVGKWQCEYINYNDNITLDIICDGKIDCLDETDETDCMDDTGMARVQANIMFHHIQDSLIAWSKKVPYETIRKQLLNLNKMTKKLQQLCIKQKPDLVEVRRVRDKYISEIESVYMNTLQYATSADEMTETYSYLNTLVNNLVSALKRSNTGNINTKTSEGCYCENDKCVMSKCSNKCIRACAIEMKLTRYYCDGRVNNSVPVTAVCNGTKECLGGDDELDCSKEVCQKKHLVALRHELHTVAHKIRDTPVGAALTSWVKQASSTLLAAENEGRPSRTDINRLVNIIIEDLLLVYAEFEESKNSNSDLTFNQFYVASRQIMKLLNSCGQ